jgi:hypothetical protein
MADQHIGYPGSVNSAQLSLWVPNVGVGQYHVEGLEDARVITNAVGDRGITIKSGKVIGDGIVDVFENNTQLNLAAVNAGSPDRWDMVVLRRLWNATPGASTSTYTIIQGGPNRSLPARNNNQGVLADQPIALCRVKAGSTMVQEIVDLRCWAHNAGMVALDELVMSYQNQVGTTININGSVWTNRATVSGATYASAWVNERGSGPWVQLSQPAGWVSNGICRARLLMNEAFLQVQADVHYTGSQIFEGWILANLPVGMRPVESTFVPGTTNGYTQGTFYIVHTSGISVGPYPVGTICQLNGVVPMK